jgi:hypothetical protein
MAPFYECMLKCARKYLTPPTLSETRFIDNNFEAHEVLLDYRPGPVGESPCSTRLAMPPLRCSGRKTSAETRGLLQRAHVVAGEIRYVGKETDRRWEEGDDISVLESKNTEYGRSKRVVASEEVKQRITEIGINKCARESGFDRKNFIRKLLRNVPVKRNSYERFRKWLQEYRSRTTINGE